MIKKLRNCSAYVNINDMGFYYSYELVSYSTLVAVLTMVDGTIVDDNGIKHEHHDMALLLGDCYDCSNTTMSHIRKFIEDYIGVRLTIADIREALKTDNHLYGELNVYRCSWT